MARKTYGSMIRLGYREAMRFFASVLASGKNPDGTDYAIPISGDLTLDPTNLALDDTVSDLSDKVPALGAALTAAAVPVSIATDNTPTVLDGGPATALTHTNTNSADMQVAANVSGAPTAGKKLVVCGFVISVGATAQIVTFKEETSGTVLAGPYYVPVNGTVVVRPSGTRLFKTAVADKKVQATASAAGNITIQTWAFSEA